MRFSPRPMEDYRTNVAQDSPANFADSEAHWNLIWLSYPEVDKFLVYKHGRGNFIKKSAACLTTLKTHPDLVDAMDLGPIHFAHYIRIHPRLESMKLYREYGESWLRAIALRGGKCAVTSCHQESNIVHVNFRGAHNERDGLTISEI